MYGESVEIYEMLSAQRIFQTFAVKANTGFEEQTDKTPTELSRPLLF
jgi:hypothetical protein